MPKFETNGIEVFYQDLNRAAAGPVVLLIVGLEGAGSAFGPFLPVMSANRRVIVPDYRGCGQSTHTLDGITLSQLASDFANLIRSLDCGAVHVVGESAGGAIGQTLAIEQPDVVRSLVCVASWGRSDDYFKEWFRIRKQIVQSLSWDTHVALTQLLLYSPDYWAKNTHQRNEGRASMLAAGSASQAKEGALARIDMIMNHDAISALAKLEVPLLSVTGNNDVICPPHLGRELADAARLGEYEEIENSGHFSHEERTEILYSIIDEFIRKQEA